MASTQLLLTSELVSHRERNMKFHCSLNPIGRWKVQRNGRRTVPSAELSSTYEGRGDCWRPINFVRLLAGTKIRNKCVGNWRQCPSKWLHCHRHLPPQKSWVQTNNYPAKIHPRIFTWKISPAALYRLVYTLRIWKCCWHNSVTLHRRYQKTKCKFCVYLRRQIFFYQKN